MATNKVPPIVVSVTGQDDVSKMLGDVAKKVKELQTKYGTVEIDAEAEAARAQAVLKDLRDTVETLDKTDPKVKVLADTVSAMSDVKSVAELIERLERADAEVEVTADTSKAEGDLKDVTKQAEGLSKVDAKINVVVDEDAVSSARGRFRQLGDDAEVGGRQAGQRFGATFVRDIGSTLNQGTAGVIGDIADAFVTAGDSIGEQVGGKIGSAISGVAGTAAAAFGIGGVAFVAATQFWNLFVNRGNDAKKRLEEMQKIQQQLAQGQLDAAVADIQKNLGRFDPVFKSLGTDLGEVTRLVTGQQTALPELTDSWDRYGNAQGLAVKVAKDNNISFERALELVGQVRGAVEGYGVAWDKTGRSLADAGRRELDIAKGLGASSAQLVEVAKKYPDLTDDVLDYVSAQEQIPPEILTEIRTDADPDDLRQVEDLLDMTAEDREALFLAAAITRQAGGELDATARDRIAEIIADAESRDAEGRLTVTARTRVADVIAQAIYGKAEADLGAVERTRVSDVIAQAYTADAETRLVQLTRDRTVRVTAVTAQSELIGKRSAQGGVQRFANGGVALVGERGPELVGMPEGANVQPTERIRSWLFAAIADAVRASGPSVNLSFSGDVGRVRAERDAIAAIRRYYRHNGQIISGGGSL